MNDDDRALVQSRFVQTIHTLSVIFETLLLENEKRIHCKLRESRFLFAYRMLIPAFSAYELVTIFTWNQYWCSLVETTAKGND